VIPLGHAARVNIVGISILRYLLLKNTPVSPIQIHLEWCFCNSYDNWDLTEKDFRIIVRNLRDNRLCEEFIGENERFYKISPHGIQLLKQFIEIDTNIVMETWK
jgi:lysyl-tRNA synthetase class I